MVSDIVINHYITIMSGNLGVSAFKYANRPLSKWSNGVEQKVIDNFEIKIDHNEVIQSLGYNNQTQPTAMLNNMFNRLFKEGWGLLSPRGIYVINQIRSNRDGMIYIENSFAFSSDILSRTLSGATHLAIFLVTIGKKLAQRVLGLMQQERMAEAMALDSYGSKAVEAAAEWMESCIGDIASARGEKITRRFSPGYCDWDIKQQEVIFNLIDSGQIGVSLTDSFMMIPEKSISAALGMGKGVSKRSPCMRCSKSKGCRDKR